MHPEEKQNTPGMCPQCGMKLVLDKRNQQQKEKHDNHGSHKGNVFARKFWLSLIASIPIVIYSPLFIRVFNFSPPSFSGSQFIAPILGTFVFFYGGWIFLSSAWREIKAKSPGMMTLISLAILTAFIYSVIQVLRGEETTLFWELATLVVVMLLGHWIEMRAVKRAQGALDELSKLLPDTVEVQRKDKTTSIPLDELRVGDIVLVRPGGRIAADGEVVDGQSSVNESLATGEAKPVQKEIGDEVIGGTINNDGSLRIKVNKIGEDSFLSGIIRLVKEAQASKSKLQLLSDRAAFYLTVIAISTGLLTLFVWLPLRGADFGFTRMVSVLVIACPHALGLAIPLVASLSTSIAAKNGFIIRQRLALEAAKNIDMVMFDKTGTLTKGEYGVSDVLTTADQTVNDILKIAASVETRSEHSVAKAIVGRAQKDNIKLFSVNEFKRIPGKGVSGTVNEHEIKIGSPALFEEMGQTLPPELIKSTDKEKGAGKTIVYVIKDNRPIGAVVLSDIIRDESRQAIQQLKKQQIQIAMITGDSKDVAASVARELNIDKYFAEVLPKHKTDKVKELQKEGRKVAMVGDGINDAPALVQADVGIAIGAGTNVAVESAGIVLVRNDPRDIPKIIKLSRLTHTKMIQNLFWATGYNVVALPLAAGIAAPWNFYLNPAVSAILMSLSTVIVAINALLLKRNEL